MKIFKKTLSVILLLALLVPAFSASAATTYGTYAEYRAAYEQFLSDDRWDPGTPWGDKKMPEHGLYSAWGCASLCSDFEYYMYGTYGWKGDRYSRAADIRTGDIIKISDPHWIIILERRGDTLYTAEKHKDQVYVSDTHYRMHDGVLQRFGYYNSKGKWVKDWKKCSFEKGYHYVDVEVDESVGYGLGSGYSGPEEPETPEEPDVDVLVSWSELPGSSLVASTDAILAMRADLWGASAKDVERGGMELYTSSGVMLGSYEEILNIGSVDTFVILQYECVSQLGIELYPEVTYSYRMYIVIAGQRYYGYFGSFTAAPPETGPDYLVGDMDNNGTVDSDDAIFLLRHTLFSDDFLIYQPADFDGDGGVSSSDAVMLLNYVLFPGDYQLNGQ